MDKIGIGPQGLGTKGNKGFWVGSPSKQEDKKVKDTPSRGMSGIGISSKKK